MIFSIQPCRAEESDVSKRKIERWGGARHGTFAVESGYPSDTSVHQVAWAHSLVLPSHPHFESSSDKMEI